MESQFLMPRRIMLALFTIGLLWGLLANFSSFPALFSRDLVSRLTPPPLDMMWSTGSAHEMLDRPVWWHAPFFGGGGYSTDAITLTLGLESTGHSPPGGLWLSEHSHWGTGVLNESRGHPLDVMLRMEDPMRSRLLRLMSPSTRAARRSEGAIVVCHSPAGCWSTPKPDVLKGFFSGENPCPPPSMASSRPAAYLVGRTMFELNRIGSDWVDRCNQMDEVWVPCEHNRQAFRDSGVLDQKLVVMPPAIDVDYWKPEKYTPLTIPESTLVLGSSRSGNPPEGQDQIPQGGPDTRDPPFVFLSVFRFDDRKGWDVLLRAYLEAFKASRAQQAQQPRVALVLRTSEADPLFDPVKHIQHFVRHKLGFGEAGQEALPPVYLMQEFIPYESLPRLYRAASAFVLPTRGGGWGLPIVEAMSMGLPVIATNWSAIPDYLDDAVGYPLAAKLGPVPGIKSELVRWAHPSVDHLRQLLQHVVEHRGEAAARGRAARARVVERYSLEAVGRRVAARLRDIQGRLAAVEPEQEEGGGS